MLAQALISCDRAQKKQHENNEKVIKRLQAELLQSEDQVKTCLKRQLKMEKEYDRIQVSYSNLEQQLGSQEAHTLQLEQQMTAAQSSHDREKAEIQAMLQEDKEECLRDEKDKFQARLAQMKALNTDLSHKMMTLQD